MTTEQASPTLPTVALVGDSIRLGYAPLVTRLLEGAAASSARSPTAATAPTC